MKPPSVRIFAIWCGVSLVAGCANMRPQVVSYRSPLPLHGIVVVVDGAGGAPDASRVVASVVEETGTPLYVRNFAWTHGVGRGITDMTDVEHARDQGRRLAVTIASYRAAYPQLPIYLMGYSAGAHVALEAASSLEPNSLERIILLAPAVSADYDLRPALLAARQGVDAFTSKRDRFFLGVGTRIVGTADGKQGVPPAGRVGFEVPEICADNVALAQRLHQHPWDPSATGRGNLGGHAGSLKSAYFRANVLPLLSPSP